MMHKHEVRGDVCYVGGTVEKNVGDGVVSRDWPVDGVFDQVAGGAAARRSAEATRRTGSAAGEVVRAPGAASDALGWLVHGRRA